MSIERRIIDYLETYGNTREVDLTNYGVQELNTSAGKMKRIIDRMAVKGKVHRIVHGKLKPPEVYITVEEPLPPDAAVEEVSTTEDVERILQEAASIAEHINRKINE